MKKLDTLKKEQSKKQFFIDKLTGTHKFNKRSDQIIEWVNLLYGAEKVLMFYKNSKNENYLIFNQSNVRSTELESIVFFDEKIISNDNIRSNEQVYPTVMDLCKFSLFSDNFTKNLINIGFSSIIPFMVGKNCTGGVIFDRNEKTKSERATEFEDSLKDISYIMEIGFVERLRFMEEWEKNVIIDVGKKISSMGRVDSVLKVIIESLKNVINYDAAGIFLIDGTSRNVVSKTVRGYPAKTRYKLNLKVGKGIIGWAVKNKKVVNVHNVLKDDRYVAAKNDTLSELVVPIFYGKKILGAINLEKNTKSYFNLHHIELLETFAAQTAIVLQNSRLLEKNLEIKEIKKEFEIAKGVQKALLPQSNPDYPGFDFASVNISRSAIGGDLYDFIRLSKTHVGVAIGDVSGKSIPGAVIMASLYSSLRWVLRRECEPAEVVKNLNTMLFEQTERDKFATFFYAILDTVKNTFSFANAGHNPPFLMKKNGEYKELSAGGPLLGMIEKVTYSSGLETMESGDVIILYTDGVSETIDSNDEEFGEEGILKTLKKYKNLTSQDILDKLLERLKRYSGNKRQDDDITIVIIKKL